MSSIAAPRDALEGPWRTWRMRTWVEQPASRSRVKRLGENPMSSGPKSSSLFRPEAAQLRPLTSIRFLAALHLFFFHVQGGRDPSQAPQGLANFPIFEEMGPWLLRCAQHGYCSTSLFFILSGFILTHLYADAEGRMTVRWGSFLWARFSRIYPLHMALVVCLIPVAIRFMTRDPITSCLGLPIPPGTSVVIGLLLSLTLTQAWVPEFALSFNFPTWALSAIVFFYLIFPWLLRRIAALTPTGKWTAMLLLPGAALLPSLIYHAVFEVEQRGSVWSEFVMRTPAFWVPHFAMGMLLARVFNITRHDHGWQRLRAYRFLVTQGDLAAVALLVIFCSSDGQLRRWLLFDRVEPHMILRHGLLTPLFLVLIYDLALGRGACARLLSWRPLARLGEASFSIFLFQFPVLLLASRLARIWPGKSGSLLITLTLLLVALSMASVHWLEKPTANWLRTNHWKGVRNLLWAISSRH